jgi:hypothetical protein
MHGFELDPMPVGSGSSDVGWAKPLAPAVSYSEFDPPRTFAGTRSTPRRPQSRSLQ